MFCGMLSLTPYANWCRQHAGHHANWNNLDKRYSGLDIYFTCMTVKEYRALTAWKRLVYRVSRHPLIAHVLIPPLVFLVLYRVPFDTPKSWSGESRAVYLTDVALGVLIVTLGLLVGFRAVLLVQAPVLFVTSIIVVWLFAVQHRFDTALWARQSEWHFSQAALEGASYLRLPRLLQWFTGNIGFHNVHHFAPRIPNYRLQHCYVANAEFQQSPPQTFSSAFRSIRLASWDEDTKRLVAFRDIRSHSAPNL